MSYESKTKTSFKKKFFLFFLFVLLFAFCFLPYASKGLALEGDYPKIGTLTIEQVSKKAVDPTHLMKFAANWVIAAAVLMIFVNIIYAGIAYILSSGKPNSVLRARTRIKNSFLGLLIVAFSYLILLTLNPQLSIFQLERKSVPVGVLLLSKDGYDGLRDGADVLDLIQEEQAYPLTHDLSDTGAVLGDLAVEQWAGSGGGLTPQLPTGSQTATAGVVNFSKTPLYAIAFWGEIGDDSRIVFYPKANFEVIKGQEENKPVYFDKRGQVTEKGELVATRGAQTINVGGLGVAVVLIPAQQEQGFFKSEVDFKPASLVTYQKFSAKEKENTEIAKRLVVHPPLSIALKVYSPGVYFYSLDGEELYLNQSAPDLRDYNYNEQPYYIRIQNTRRLLSGGLDRVTTDGKYFAVLFSDFQYTGSSKVFFPKIKAEGGAGDTITEYDPSGQLLIRMPDLSFKKLNDVLATYAHAGTDIDIINLPKESNFILENGQTKLLSGQALYKEVMQAVKYKELNPKGNAPENTSIEIFPNTKVNDPQAQALVKSQVRYGDITSVSSVQVFQYEDDYSVCQKVVLCTQEGGLSNPDSKCLIYLDPNSTEFKEQKLVKNQVKYLMPLYEPVNLPRAYVFTGTLQDGDYGFEAINFSDSIKSIEIEPTDGKCLVGLFSNTLKFDNNGFKEWSGGTTGVSNFFTQTNLTLTQSSEIGKCGGLGGALRNQPCASSIVVYPIKPVAVSPVRNTGYSGGSGGPVSSGEARITIRRTECSTAGVKGVLTLETAQTSLRFNTLELPWNNNAEGASAIPSGSYPNSKMRYDAHDGHGNVVRRIQINDVKNRGGIQVHAGSKIADTEGCVLIFNSNYSIAQSQEEELENAVIQANAHNNIKVNIINECGGTW